LTVGNFPFNWSDYMRKVVTSAKILAAVALGSVCFAAWAQTTVSYGRITAVANATVQSQGAQTGGALLGGALGIASGSGQSGSNRALRGVGGAMVGSRVAQAASNRPAFQYTILVGSRTITMVTDEGGFRVGDCVSVEQGAFNNLRLAPDSRCAPNVRATPAAVNEANACNQAKQALLEANTDEAFDRAERRVRLLCAD
jgi:outer membrane lipoprotein SlyB